MSPVQKSFVVLSMNGETVASLENPPSRAGSTRRRRNVFWEYLTSCTFKSKREKNEELAAQLREEEEGGSPHFCIESRQRREQQSTREMSNHSVSPPLSSLHKNHLDTSTASRINDLPISPEEEEAIASRWSELWTELKSLLKDLVEYGKAKTWKKKIVTVLFGVISMLVFYDLLFGKQDYIVTWLHAFIVWMTSHHAAAVFAFVGIFVLSTLAFVPPTLLVFGAGYAFTMAMDSVLAGVTAATLSCFLGSAIGGIIAFLRSKYLMRDLVQLFATRYPLVRAIDQALKVNHGFWIMFLLRLCPIIPFNGLNYCCGITGVTLHDFTLSMVGILPFQIYTVILGATAGVMELQNLRNDEYTTTEKWAFIGFVITGAIFGLLAIVYGWRLVKRELRRELSLSPEEFESVIHSDGGSSSFSFHLQEGDTSFRNDGEMSVRSSEGLTAYQGEDEEWFWIWA